MPAKKLSMTLVRNARPPAGRKSIKIAGGDGLYLYVRRNADGGLIKSWVFRYVAPNSKPREMGLGSVRDLDLERAQESAARLRALVQDGRCPLTLVQGGLAKPTGELIEQEEVKPDKPTFRQVVEEVWPSKRAEISNFKHAQEWLSSLRRYAYPVIGDVSVDEVTEEQVLSILSPIWLVKTETAQRVARRMAQVFEYALYKGYRVTQRDNPASMDTAIRFNLPKAERVKQQEHFEAVPYREMPEFCPRLWERAVGRRHNGSAQALMLLILTVVRTGAMLERAKILPNGKKELIRGVEWSEIDFESQLWTIPASRMKTGFEFVVPLSDQAIELLTKIRPAHRRRGLIFPSPRISYAKEGRGISEGAMLGFLQGVRGMNEPDYTVHGFRSTFRDWAGETTLHDRLVIEMAMAHKIKDKVEAAYARGNQLEKRRVLMQEWADYCLPG